MKFKATLYNNLIRSAKKKKSLLALMFTQCNINLYCDRTSQISTNKGSSWTQSTE